MYSIQWLMKGIEEGNVMGVPQYLRYAAHPHLISMEFDKVENIYDEIMQMGKTVEASKEAVEMNAWMKRMRVTVTRALEHIHCRGTKDLINTMLNKMTIMNAELVTTLLGV